MSDIYKNAYVGDQNEFVMAGKRYVASPVPDFVCNCEACCFNRDVEACRSSPPCHRAARADGNNAAYKLAKDQSNLPVVDDVMADVAAESKSNVCLWTWDTDGFYAADCGHAQQFWTASIAENDYHYCPRCGRRIVEKRGGAG